MPNNNVPPGEREHLGKLHTLQKELEKQIYEAWARVELAEIEFAKIYDRKREIEQEINHLLEQRKIEPGACF